MDPARGLQPFPPFCPERNLPPYYPPTLLLHGDADTDVPYAQSVAMAAALDSAGVKNELLTIPDGPHGYINTTTRDDYESSNPTPAAKSLHRTLAFLKDKLPTLP